MDSLLARVWALSSDQEQAQFLNVAGATLRRLCKLGEGSEEMQLFRIADQLDEDGKRFIRKLVEMSDPVPF